MSPTKKQRKTQYCTNKIPRWKHETVAAVQLGPVFQTKIARQFSASVKKRKGGVILPNHRSHRKSSVIFVRCYVNNSIVDGTWRPSLTRNSFHVRMDGHGSIRRPESNRGARRRRVGNVRIRSDPCSLQLLLSWGSHVFHVSVIATDDQVKKKAS